MQTFTDIEIMKILPQADQMQIKLIYKQFRLGFINTIIKIFNCSEEQALGIYPESFTNFYFNIKSGKLTIPLQSKLITYLIAIGKNVYRNRYYDSYSKKVQLEDEFTTYEDELVVEDIQSKKEAAQLVKQLLKSIGDPCETILRLFYIRNFSIEAIMQEMSMISEGAVRKKKFDCIMQLRKMISNG